MAEKQQHQTFIVSDEPVTVHVSSDGGPWFRMWSAIVRGGHWARLSPPAKGVFVVLAEAVNDAMRRDRGDWLAWPSVGTIMELAGIRRTATYDAIDELERAGLLRRRTNGGGRKTTTYQLLPPRVSSLLPVRHGGPHPSGQADPTRPPRRTQRRTKNEDRETNSADAAAVVLREAEGFARPDADRLAAAFGPAAVAQARRLADERERVKPLRSRRGFIVKALEESWTPAKPQARPRPKQQPAGVPAQGDDAAAAERREIEDQQRRVNELLAKIDPATFDAEAARVLDAMPEATARLYRKLDPRRSATIRAAVAERVGKAGQGGRLAELLAGD